MDPAWQILCDGGVPLAVPRSGARPTADELARAALDVIPRATPGREAEALAAFLFAWRHHWPESFAGRLGDTELAWAASQLPDDNRYLKLRRIAIEHLSTLL
ncbi:MAG: hypothetical protein ABI678_16670 [Kofleriaceae bacterium]